MSPVRSFAIGYSIQTALVNVSACPYLAEVFTSVAVPPVLPTIEHVHQVNALNVFTHTESNSDTGWSFFFSSASFRFFTDRLK